MFLVKRAVDHDCPSEDGFGTTVAISGEDITEVPQGAGQLAAVFGAVGEVL